MIGSLPNLKADSQVKVVTSVISHSFDSWVQRILFSPSVRQLYPPPPVELARSLSSGSPLSMVSVMKLAFFLYCEDLSLRFWTFVSVTPEKGRYSEMPLNLRLRAFLAWRICFLKDLG